MIDFCAGSLFWVSDAVWDAAVVTILGNAA